MTRRRLAALLAAVVVLGAAGAAVAVVVREGRIGPSNRIQPSGRLLNPVGRQVKLGNLPRGGALTPDGRFYWTVSAGRGRNDVRIVRVRDARVVQILPLPGSSGGIAMAPDGRRAYVSGTQEGDDRDEQSPRGTPGKEGDVIHVFAVARGGRARRRGVISVPPPPGTPRPQSFGSTPPRAWPRDLAVSPNGRTLLAALNLADAAAVVDLGSKQVRYVPTGRFPYGAAITRDGRRGLVSNEASGTVSVIDLASATKVRDIQVGPRLSHPEGIAVDSRGARAYVAVTHQDLVAVLDLRRLRVERTLSVERPQGLGTGSVDVAVAARARRLLVANSGEDAVAVFALPGGRGEPRLRGAAARQADRVLQHEARRGVEQTESEEAEAAELYGEEAEEEVEERVAARPARRRSPVWRLVGRLPVGSYPIDVAATPDGRRLVWASAKGLGVGPNAIRGRGGYSPERYRYLPSSVTGRAGVLRFPSDRRVRRLDAVAERQVVPANRRRPPRDTPLRPRGPLRHVFYIVRENRTYDQVFGDERRGDGDPKLTLFGRRITPNAHALARRFGLLDHVYANSEASIDGHFWTSAAAVSDYVVRNWHQNYGGRGRPYDFGLYSVTWPATGFLFDRAERQGISYFNWGEAIAGTIGLLPDRDRPPGAKRLIDKKYAKSDLGPRPLNGCFSNDVSSGGIDNIIATFENRRVEVYDSSLPRGAPRGSLSRFDCFRRRFRSMVRRNRVPRFSYITLPNDHTAGTSPGSRTPSAMVAENDYALGQIVDLISHSPVWKRSLILVIEDDSQDGADHVDAHRIPALAISPYSRRGAVVHTRYDFLSFIRSLELVTGIKPLNLFDAVATPLYDVMDPDASDNDEPFEVLRPKVNLVARNRADAPNARLSRRLPLGWTDRTPQRILDRILWQSVHGPRSEPPPPGPNASGLDEARWRKDALTPAEAREELLERAEEEREEAEEEEDVGTGR